MDWETKQFNLMGKDLLNSALSRWLIAGAEFMRGSRAPSPQRCQCTRGVRQQNLIPLQKMIPGAGSVWSCIKQQFSSFSPLCLQTRMRPS
ncbi:hypothetical protein TNCV_3983531 [Trichonephila clavipes]|nr:hypothetical protein TNCV_3983531 [Trichonephila clavipes]